MNKSNKLYKEALALFEKGKIDKAIEACEKSIAEDIRNKAAIDLKGMILYIKGDLKEAKKMWQLNSKVNNDKAAQKYLQGIDNDEKLFEYFLKALTYMGKLKINEALELLERCERSEYNTINISNNIAICAMKQGDYDKASVYLEKVLKLDRANETALQTKKQLEGIGVIKPSFNFKFLVKPIAAVAIIILVVFGSIYVYNGKFKKPSKVSKGEPKKTAVKKQVVKEPVKIVQKPQPKTETKPEVKFDEAELQNAINNKDYEKIIYYEENFKDKDLRVNDKILMNKALEALKNDGVAYFYGVGNDYAKKNDYANAEKYLLKAYTYGSSNYLYKDVLYFLATSYKNSGDMENAIKYYTMYDASYKTGSYEETVLYELAVIYKDIDKQKAKEYANNLVAHYPKSMYNNSIIKSIISN